MSKVSRAPSCAWNAREKRLRAAAVGLVPSPAASPTPTEGLKPFCLRKSTLNERPAEVRLSTGTVTPAVTEGFRS